MVKMVSLMGNHTGYYECDVDNKEANQDGSGSYLGDSKTNSLIQTVLYIYTLPILITTGVISNICTYHVIRKSNLNKCSVCVYIEAYAVSNILSLCLNSGMDWAFLIVEQKHFRNDSDSVCCLWMFFHRLITFSGAWFVVAMACDRYIVVWHKIRKKEMCTLFVARFTIVIILVGMVSVSVHSLWSHKLRCGWCEIGDHQHQAMWGWVSGVIYTLVPSCIVFVLTGAICFKLIACRNEGVFEKLTHNLTVSVVVYGSLFICLSTPGTVSNIIDNAIPAYMRKDPSVQRTLSILRDISQCLLWLNYNAMFPVLFSCCSEFRMYLMKLFCCNVKDTPVPECTAV